jgi:hypothetical protein
MVTDTRSDLRRILHVNVRVGHAAYELHKIGSPAVADVLAPRMHMRRTALAASPFGAEHRELPWHM